MNGKCYFDGVAGDWDLMREGFFSESVRDKALCTADVQEGRMAVDIGAGTGFMTEGLLGKGLKVIAVDFSRAMLDTIKDKFDNHAGLECRLGLADRLPLEDDSVDYAFANMLLHHVEEPAAVIKEIARILKPGGTAVLTDLDEHDHAFLRQEHHDRWMGFKRKDVAAWFSRAGLTDVAVRDVGEDCCSDSCDSTRSARVGIFLASGSKKKG